MNKSFRLAVGQVVLAVCGVALVGIQDVRAGQDRTSSAIDAKENQSSSVLPFVHRGTDPESDWIGIGIADTITAHLDGAPRVNPRRNGRDFREGLLGNVIVSGSYQVLEGQLQITARLTHKDTAEVLASFSVDGMVEELFQLQDQLATWVLRELTAGRTEETRMNSGDSIVLIEAETTSLVRASREEDKLSNASERAFGVSGITEQERAAGVVNELFTVEPPRAVQPPEIDGVLDEPAWANAAVIENFTQQEPNEGEPATERTIVRLMYDSESLYIAMEAHDSIADGVIATEMRRDSL
ncbi:MAG: hypothetical protein VB674_01240, partial [Vicinamibacterales bacterium]